MRNLDAGEWSLTDCEEKKYDAKQTASFSDDLARDFQDYHDRAKDLEAGYGRYYNNTTYVGSTADASKEFIGTRQTEEIHYENLDIQKEFIGAVGYIEDAFKQMVDPSPNAKIDSVVVKEIKHEQQAFSRVFDEEGYALERWTQRMVDKFGRFGVSTLPSCSIIRARHEELSGPGGHLDKCIKKLKEFDDFSLTYLNQSGIKERSYKLQRLIKNTAGKLDNFTVYQPNMPQKSISLVALGANMVSGNVHKKYSGVLSRANSTRTPNKTHKNDIKPEVRILMNQYGYTEEEAKLIDKAITALNTNLGVIKLDNNGDYYIKIANTYGILSELCINYNSTRWRMATGQYNTKQSIEHLKKVGLSDQEILDLRVLINLQHGDYRYSELRAAGIDIDKSTFKNETFTSINARAKTESDFAHTVVQIAAFAHGDDVYKNNRPELGRGIVDYINASANSKLTVTMSRYEISFKGDLDSGRYSEADYRSDLDAINIYERMIKNGDFGMKTWASYYNDVDNDSRHRAVEFLENMGDGHADIGILNTKKVIDEVSLGSEYIQVGNGTDVPKAKKIFMQWLLCTYQGVEYDFPKQE